jgi:hypothetical protein
MVIVYQAKVSLPGHSFFIDSGQDLKKKNLKLVCLFKLFYQIISYHFDLNIHPALTLCVSVILHVLCIRA